MRHFAAVANILTRCPTTGRVIETGLDTETILFDSLRDVPVPLECAERRTSGVARMLGWMKVAAVENSENKTGGEKRAPATRMAEAQTTNET
jgi:hypothetical protein